jgi:hypothetical protein
LGLLISLIVLSLGPVAAQEDSFVANAKKGAVQTLRDPESARFDQVRVVTNSLGKKGVCGLINAKNAYGGYVGFKKFSFDGLASRIADDEGLAESTLERYRNGEDTVPFYTDEVLQLHLLGCDGPLKESRARFVDSIQFSCKALWLIHDGVINRGASETAAVEEAIVALKGKASDNKVAFSPETESELRATYKQALAGSLKDPKVVDLVKRSAAYPDGNYIFVCKQDLFKARHQDFINGTYLNPTAAPAAAVGPTVPTFSTASGDVTKPAQIETPTQMALPASTNEKLQPLNDQIAKYMEAARTAVMNAGIQGARSGRSIGVDIISSPEGVLVVNPIPGRPGAKAGLVVGDIITAINGIGVVFGNNPAMASVPQAIFVSVVQASAAPVELTLKGKPPVKVQPE